MPEFKEQVDAELSKRGLVSVMNDTKWAELQGAVRRELPFSPPFQLKVVLRSEPEPEHFESDVDYLGDWSDECLSPFYAIEWLRIRPRYLHRRGRLIAPEEKSVEPAFTEILRRYSIPYRRDGDTIRIYGYASSTSDVVRDS